MNKAFHGTAALVKGMGNVGILMTVEAAKKILNNPNASDEQKAKARETLSKFDK